MPDSAAPLHVQLVDAMRALAGPHPGIRAAHAKGIVCSGTFHATPDARHMSKAPHFQGPPLPPVIRFSNSIGNPDVHDALPGVRTMSVKFELAGGKSADILANSVEGFIARTPEEFLEFLRAQLPDPASGKPDPDAVPRFLAAHPAGRAFVERLMKKPVPASDAQVTYHAEHARFASPPRMGRADSAAIASSRWRARPSSPLTRAASGLRASYTTSSTATRPRYGPTIGSSSSWGAWRSRASLRPARPTSGG